ncbi:MAG: LysR substrate-binding domain-containing protein [Hyphomicrobiaceae bacterium]
MVQRLPPLHALRAFEAVARLGSVTAAADDLCVTHSAVSHQIRQLEEWLGIRLLERNGRGIVLTSAGELYRSSVCEAFARLVEGTRVLERSGDRSSVRIGALPMFLTSWLQPRMRAFWAQHPEIDVTISYKRPTTLFDPAETDLAVLFGLPEYWPDYQAQAIMEGHAVPVCSRDYLERTGPIRKPADILKCQLIHDDSRTFWAAWLRKAGLDPRLAEQGPILADGSMTLSSVLAGDGVGLLRRAVIGQQLLTHSLVQVSDIDIEGDLTYVLLSSEASLRRNVVIFRDWLIATIEAEKRSPIAAVASGRAGVSRIADSSATFN